MLTDLINEYYDTLNPTDIYVLEKILKLESSIDHIGIEELAKLCNTSKSTIMRIAKKVGFSGYSDFKSYIKWERCGEKNIEKTDLFGPIAYDFSETVKQMENSNQLKTLVKEIYDSNTVVLFGTGVGQRYCAEEMQRLFMQTNKHMYLIDGKEEFVLSSKGLGEGALVIVFSLSGNANFIEEALQVLKINGAKLASITNLQPNKLSSYADYRLYAVTSPLNLSNGLIHNSFIDFFVVIEYLFREFCKYQDEIKNHQKLDSK